MAKNQPAARGAGIPAYVALQLALLPASLLGAALAGDRQLRVSRRLGLSQTAVGVLNGRWAMDLFGLRPDKAARQLSRVLPNNSVPGVWLALLPLYLSYRLTGERPLYQRPPEEGKERPGDLLVARTFYFDKLIEARADEAEQFVVLGAGLDTRCYGGLKDKGLAMFELDQPDMSRMKRKSLRKAGIDADHVRFVEVDFAGDDWTDDLVAAGFDPELKTIFLWEGVTPYLHRDDVSATLEAVRSVSAPGSVLVCDLYAERFVDLAKWGIAARVLEATREDVHFGVDFSGNHEVALQAFLDEEGLEAGAQHFLGARTRWGPFMAVVEILL